MNQDLTSSLPENQLSDKTLFIQIWTSPRKVFRLIHDLQYEKYFYVLLCLAGIAGALDRASMKNYGDTHELGFIIGSSVIGGGLFGWFSFYVYAALVSWTGNWLKAEGKRSDILRIFAYAMIPSVIGLLFLIPQIGIYGIELFKEEGDLYSAGLVPNIVVYSSMAMEFALAVYTLILCVIGVSEVQKLSIGKAILNLLLPLLVIGLPLLLLAGLFSLGG